MNTVQIQRQRDLLQSIVLDISDIEQIAFGSSLAMKSKQQILGEKLYQIRQTALAGINDRESITMILRGYHDDCISQLSWMWETFEDLGFDEDVVKDEQLQQLSLAARNFSNLADKYLQLKSTIASEVDNG